MNYEKFLKSKTFTIIFLIWLLVINVLYYWQFKDIYKLLLKKIGLL